MVVHQPLQPLRAILHRTHNTRRLCAAAICLGICLAGECLSIRQAREVRQVGGVGLGQSVRATADLHLANGQRLHFSPFTAQQRHHRPIGAQVLHRWPVWRRWPLALKPLNLSGLLGDIGGPSSLGVPPHRRFIQFDSPEEGDFRRRLLEWHLGALPRHAFGERGAQLAW